MPSPPKNDANRAEKIARNKRDEIVAWQIAMMWKILKKKEYLLPAFRRGEGDGFRQLELKRVNDLLAAVMHNPDKGVYNDLFLRKRALEFLLKPDVVKKRNKELQKGETSFRVKTTTPTGTVMCQELVYEVGGLLFDPVTDESKSPGLRKSTRATQSAYFHRVLEDQWNGDLLLAGDFLLAGDDTDMADSSAAGGGGVDVKQIREKQLQALIDKFQKRDNFKQFWTSYRSKSGALYFQHNASGMSCWPADFRQVCQGTHSECRIPAHMRR